MNQVQLAVYDLSRGMARAMSQSILGQQIDGIWHTGIVVFGQEYYFGGGIQVSPWGIFSRSNNIHIDNLLEMGHTTKSRSDLENYLRSIQNQFTQQTYDLIRNNCNNFADTVCKFLTGHGIPDHIVNLPRIVFSTPGGAMLRPMIEGMQNNIRQQQGYGLDPFGSSSSETITAANSSVSSMQFESALSESMHSIARTLMTPAKLDEQPLVSGDSGTVNMMATKLINLAASNEKPGSALTSAEKEHVQELVTKLQTEKSVIGKSFAIQDYQLMERLLANHPDAHLAILFILRLMFLHDHVTDFGKLEIIRELISRLLGRAPSFASIPSHVMALCAISNLLSHENGLATILTEKGSEADSAVSSALFNDIVDVSLSGLSHSRSEVRQMSAALANNITIACATNERYSPWKSDKSDSEMSPHALQLLCACIEGITLEQDSIVRKRKLSVACRIGRFSPNIVGSLLSDLGFDGVLQVFLSDKDIRPALTKEETDIVAELCFYCKKQ